MDGDCRITFYCLTIFRYSHLFFTDDHGEQFASLCVQLLNLLLDFDPSSYNLDTLNTAKPRPLEDTTKVCDPNISTSIDNNTIGDIDHYNGGKSCQINNSVIGTESVNSSPECNMPELFKSPVSESINSDTFNEGDLSTTLESSCILSSEPELPQLPVKSLLEEVSISSENAKPNISIVSILFGDG